MKSLWNRIKKLNKLFIWIVLVPTGLSILYFGLIASPVYISEARFVVYSPNQRVSSSGLASLLSNLGGSNSTSAAQTISSFIASWDGMMSVNKLYPLKQIYGNSEIDIFNRFGGVFYPYTSYVRLWRYYQSMVADTLDSSNGISELKVRAYTAKDAQKINDFLLKKSQDIVNQLNATARSRAVFYAKQDVEQAKRSLRDATLALAEYRNNHRVFSPPAQSSLQLGMVSRLQDQLITQQTELSSIMAHAPANPQIPVLKSSIQALQGQIAAEQAKVTGDRQSLASKDIEFERLTVNQLLAQKLLEAAVTSLEQARMTAQKQELYLETISRPNLPDAPQEPKRFEDILAVLIVSLMIWGVSSILYAGVKEHHER
nr:capsule biosynthesis protein [Acidithiobacillus montserratensis]